MKRLWSLILTIVVAVVAMAGSATMTQTVGHAANNKRVLVVYFSETKGVYGGNLKKGNTQQVANFIQQRTGADTYRIIPKKAYPTNYNQVTKVAQKEQNEHARPAIKGQLPNVKKYRTIFIGAPIWWGEYPMIVRTFLDHEPALNGKNLVPFTTNEGSGLGNTSSVLKKQFPKATVKKGFSARGHVVKNNPQQVQKRVNSWLKGLGY